MNNSNPSPMTFDFSNLMPDVDSLWRLYGFLSNLDMTGFLAELGNPQALSATFVVVLGMVFAWFLIIGVFKNGILAWIKIARLSRLLRGVGAENLMAKRLDLRRQAEGKGSLGELWTEFDETLVTDGQRLQNSFDAAHFFNTHTLARGITESRMLAAVPGFLTAIGVIGTFMGLQLGLSGLDLGDTEKAQVGINQLVSGASVAFMTSVWGVGMSVLFNFLEKLVEQWARNRVAALQHRIDTLFPRVNPEQTLVAIHDENRRAAVTLDGLAEKIGNQMQQAMSDATGQMLEGMVQGLREVLEPAVGRLVDSSDALNRRQERGGEKALESLIERFGEGLQRQGREQQAALESAGSRLGEELSGWSTTMTEFVGRIEAQQQATERNNQALAEATRAHMGDMERTRDEQIGKIQDRLGAAVEQMIRQFGAAQQQWAAAGEDQQQRLQQETLSAAGRIAAAAESVGAQAASQVATLEGQSRDLVDKLETFTARMSTSVGQHVEATQALLRQSEALNGQVQEVGDGLSRSSAALRDGTGHLDRSATGLGRLADKLDSASGDLGQRLETLATDVDRLTQGHVRANTGLVQLQQSLGELGNRLQQAAAAVSKAAQGAVQQTTDLRQHQLDQQQAMHAHIEALQEKIAGFLADYGQRVQGQTTERLDEWNKQTRQFSSTMVEATKAIAEIVDEMETKLPLAA